MNASPGLARFRSRSSSGSMPRTRDGLVHVRFDRPDLLGVAEPAERRRRGRVRQDAPRDDPHRRGQVRAAGRVAALRDRPVGDIGVRADEVVRLDVAEDQGAIAAEARADADLRRAAPDGLERLLERQDEPDRSAGTEGHERDQRLVLGVLLAAEPAARIGREDADLRPAACPSTPAITRWSQFGCWIELHTATPSPSGAAMNAWGSMANWVTIGKRYVPSTTTSAVAPPRRGRPSRSGARAGRSSQRAGRRRSERRVLDERRAGRERVRDGHDRGQRLVLDPHERGSLFGGIEGLGRDGGDRLAVVVRLADGDDGAVPELRSEPRDRLRQVGGGEDEANAGHGEGGRRVDRHDPRPRRIDRDELGVEDADRAEGRRRRPGVR